MVSDFLIGLIAGAASQHERAQLAADGVVAVRVKKAAVFAARELQLKKRVGNQTSETLLAFCI